LSFYTNQHKSYGYYFSLLFSSCCLAAIKVKIWQPALKKTMFPEKTSLVGSHNTRSLGRLPIEARLRGRIEKDAHTNPQWEQKSDCLC
jgi:hypothetical protein